LLGIDALRILFAALFHVGVGQRDKILGARQGGVAYAVDHARIQPGRLFVVADGGGQLAGAAQAADVGR
jgi:hypothetical protein